MQIDRSAAPNTDQKIAGLRSKTWITTLAGAVQAIATQACKNAHTNIQSESHVRKGSYKDFLEIVLAESWSAKDGLLRSCPR